MVTIFVGISRTFRFLVPDLVEADLIGVREVDAEDVVRPDARVDGLGAAAGEPRGEGAGVVREKVTKREREALDLVVGLARHLGVRSGDGEVDCNDEGEQALEIQRKRVA